MGKESQNCRPETRLFGTIYETIKYLSVPDMDAVKGADGNGRKVLFVVFGYVLNCYQRTKKIKRLTFKPLKLL